MKKILFIIIFLISCAALSAQTGTGWTNMRAKYNFRDSININNGWKIGTVVITTTGAQFNYLSIATGTTGTGNLVFGTSPTLVTPNLGTPSAINLTNATGLTNIFISPAFTGSVPTTGGIPLGRISSITTNFSAGVETDVTLTGVTAEPYGITIFDSDGLNITHAVKDSTAASGGVYHTYIYSTDAKTDAKIKVLW